MSEFNSTCPFCGTEGELRATVESLDSNVPLRPDGFETDEGDAEGSELKEIKCLHCQAEVDQNHYLTHGPDGEPCDCVEDAATPGD